MSVCIVVPYRDRAAHLDEFLPHMRAWLPANGAPDFRILVVEQVEGKPFNRGKLLNIGVAHTKQAFECYVFHDVDMLPVECSYAPVKNPTHLSARIDRFGWNLPYPENFGGVTMFDRESFAKINGFNNGFWGWGAEDDDLLRRCRFLGVKTSRRNGAFRTLEHDRHVDPQQYAANSERLYRFRTTMNDGLSTLDYTLISIVESERFERVRVEI